ncbi:16S rRNA (cytosine(1402)-N(4))-methyltransferase RsmH [Desulfonatronospira sp. MSAO_Bac3]|uniref:16S rRNA (cytosine(1402)-N(4))-methyltransferase RsmH n=1 Tax=Desulfonatronospira sp. MSAO_Bac3 TaxID=2293857 RepID=UPI00257CAABA|nr:16S rRNA (cytosine(1402)-N(4))-methyltransferase RsmH [Desulfonatronospira sp. MSAO_Bac3]
MADYTHQPVMLEKVLELLAPAPGGRYLDGTLGLGGHSLAILKACKGECSILGMDMDQEALELVAENLEEQQGGLHMVQDAFHNFQEYLQELQWPGLDGALLDLGMSSLQLDKKEKGFSFIHDGPLDMRMGLAQGFPPASSLVQNASFSRLKQIIYELGEEPMAPRIARAIIQAREKSPINTTLELARIVEQAYPAQRRRAARNHPATKTFQALRMATNKELESLQDFLEKIAPWLRPGARLVVISFHSLEDRMVKQYLRRQASDCICPPRSPVCSCSHRKTLEILTRKPLTASEREISRNPRSRSAKLRAAQRV